MAITYFGSASTPADNGSNLADPTAVTPPSGMQAGDLVVMEASSRDTALAHAISQAGGQTWTAHAQQGVTNRSVRVFTCTFDGTWTADPSVSAGSGFCNSLIMHVYRPPGAGYTWAVNVAQESAPGSGETWTITGQTTTGSDETVTIASFSSFNDNTWGSLAGAGWAVAGAAQYRNVAGQDQSSAFAHKIQTSAGATGDVSLTQLTLAGQGGLTWILTMAAVPPAPSGYTLSAEHTTFTLSGQAATLTHNYALDAASGTFTLTGQASSLLVSRGLPATYGTFALTGQTAFLVRPAHATPHSRPVRVQLLTQELRVQVLP